MTENITVQVQYETEQIGRLFEVYADLLAHSKQETPNLVEIAALASVLHSFYNGLENIFLVIAKGLDGAAPTGSGWHRDLLARMAQATPKRSPVISPETGEALTGYMLFRHFYRHSYSFFLEWTKMRDLVTALEDVWKQTRQEFLAFLESLGPKEA